MPQRLAPKFFTTRSASKLGRKVLQSILLAMLTLGCRSAHAADHLVLRDLTSLVDVTVTAVDQDGVLLVGARRIGWDQLTFGQVSPELQEEFDRYLAELGLPLFRLRYRLQIGDYQGLAELASPLVQSFEGSTSPSARLIHLASFRGHLVAGRRAAAAVDWLALQKPKSDPNALDDPLLPWPKTSTQAFWSPELPPIWFEADEAAISIDAALAQLSNHPSPTAAERLFLASLAITAGKPAVALDQISQVDRTQKLEQDWIAILRLQDELAAGRPTTQSAALCQRLANMDPALQPLAYYELGRDQLQSDQPVVVRAGLLDLLRIPAEYPQASPDLIGAALFKVSESLLSSERADAAQRVVRELHDQHPSSWHAQFAR